MPFKISASTRARARGRAIGGAISLGRGTRPPEQCFSGSSDRDINALYALPSGTAAIISLLKPVMSDALRS